MPGQSTFNKYSKCWRIKDISLYDPQAYGPPHLFHHGIPKVLVNPRSKGITGV
jgi:hypothetical protein